MKELRERQYFSKPSLKKREKKKENIRRLKKEQKLKALKGELQNYEIFYVVNISYVQIETTREKKEKYNGQKNIK